ncbi:chaperone [Citrobacter freundii]|nr:chaperone [Citrobacter freundii]
MNEFSILCRVLGSLFYRQPQDPLLVPLFTLISEGKLSANWPLEQDELLTRLQKSCDMPQLAADYNALFVGEECAVPPYRSAWVEGAKRIGCSCISFCPRHAAGRYAGRSHWYAVAGGFMA